MAPEALSAIDHGLLPELLRERRVWNSPAERAASRAAEMLEARRRARAKRPETP